jgi:hypothetical protein
MRLLTGLLVVALLTLAGAGCSHGTISELPTAPTPRIAVLTVTPAGGGWMVEGTTAALTTSGPLPSTGATLGAFAQYTDGSGKYVEAVWSSSDPQVIAVEGGAFVAKARGTVTVTASADGKTDSETFVVEPGLDGTWSGTFTVEQCIAGGGSVHDLICYPLNQGRTPGALAVGVAAPMTLQITRTGTELIAAAQVGNLRGTLTGTERGQNLMTLQGDLTGNGTTMTIVALEARARGDQMEGAIGLEVRIAGLPSHAEVIGRIDAVTRR